MIKRAIFLISVILSFVFSLVLWGISTALINGQVTQQMGSRWNSKGEASQISCFFSTNTSITPDRIEEIEHRLDAKLLESSITLESTNAGARLWAYAYSSYGKITLTSDHGDMTADAIGIGGDFFLFHPLMLLEGSYFTGNDLMQDYCILDEDAAWRLFGSNDIAGQIVYISGIPHIVTGVVKRDDGRLQEASGLDGSVVYVSYDSLNKYGTHSGINHYEIVMPNPVKNYAFDTVKTLFGLDEQEVEIVDNSKRFDLLNRVKLIGEFGTRSMNGKAIIYPYWENIARGTEDILLVLTLFMILFFLYPFTVIIIKIIIWWKHRTWNMKSVCNKLKGGKIYEKKFF